MIHAVKRDELGGGEARPLGQCRSPEDRLKRRIERMAVLHVELSIRLFSIICICSISHCSFHYHMSQCSCFTLSSLLTQFSARQSERIYNQLIRGLGHTEV